MRCFRGTVSRKFLRYFIQTFSFCLWQDEDSNENIEKTDGSVEPHCPLKPQVIRAGQSGVGLDDQKT